MIAEKIKIPASVVSRFDRLADEWELATSLLSSPIEKARHPTYQKIVKMGPRILPLILQRMKVKGGQWFWALGQIAKANPVPESARGNISKMRNAWLKWGKEHGYSSEAAETFIV
jgi:hypothetical protein